MAWRRRSGTATGFRLLSRSGGTSTTNGGTRLHTKAAAAKRNERIRRSAVILDSGMADNHDVAVGED